VPEPSLPASIFALDEPEAALAAATRKLARRDPVMAGLVKQHGPCRLGDRRGQRSHFGALVESVVYQQLAGTAARAIFGRLSDVVGDPPTPEGVLGAGDGALRGAGLSGSKAACIQALAEAAVAGQLGLDEMEKLPDEEVGARLTAVRGIGRWTADMFLIFQLGRLDVWPVGDYGVRKGYARAYGLSELPTPKALTALGEPLRPYRSVAAWYCWRATAATLPGGRA
jgi:3-methyladenine DNA glycosylase/8-oxoguanine DNA glycosylase